MGVLGDIADFFTSSPPSSEGGGDGAPAPVQGGGGIPAPSQTTTAAAAPSATVTNPSLAAQAAQIQAAIAKLSIGQPQNDPMMYFQAAAGLGSPTQSGSFFEGLGKMNKNVGDYMMANRDLQMKGLGAQAQLLGIQADLPLKEMQAKELQRKIDARTAAGGIMQGRPGIAPTPAPATIAGAPSPSSPAASAASPEAKSEKPANPAEAIVSGVTMANPQPIIPRDLTGPQSLKTATAKTGLTPAVDLLGDIQRGQQLMMLGADDPNVFNMGKTIYEQAHAYIKDGKIPVIGPDGSVAVAPMPGELQRIYATEKSKADATVGAENAKAAFRIAQEGAKEKDVRKFQNDLEFTHGTINGVEGVYPNPEYRAAVKAGLAKEGGKSASDIPMPVLQPGKIGMASVDLPNRLSPVGTTALEKELAGADKKAIEESADAAKAASAVQLGVKQAQARLPGFETGPGADLRMKTGAVLQALGADKKVIADTLGNTTDAQIISKEAFKIASAQTRAMGGKEPGFVLNQFSSNNPNLDLLPDTNKFMFAAINADAQRTKDYNAELNAHASKYQNLRDFEDAFNRAHPVESYIVQSFIDAGAPVQIPAGPVGDKIAALVPQGYAVIPPGSKTPRIMDHSKKAQ